MDQFSLILLGLFALVVLVYIIGSFLILYHLIRFGIGTQPKKYALFFLAGSVILLFVASAGFLVSLTSISSLEKNAKNLFHKTNNFRILNLSNPQ
jgi:hypothetical protein